MTDLAAQDMTAYRVEPIATTEEDKAFGVQRVRLLSDPAHVDFSIQLSGKAEAYLPSGQKVDVIKYGNGYAYLVK